MPALLLAAALAAAWWFMRGEIPWMPRPRTRIAMFRRWLVKDALGILLPALLGLALIGRLRAIGHAPPELLVLRDGLPPELTLDAWPLLVGGSLGLVLGLLLSWRAGRRGRASFAWGRIEAVVSHRGDEIPYGLARAVMAGVSEELFHRLFVPLLGSIATGSAAVGAGGSLLLFAAMHRYQGWRGMIATGVIGALFQALYLLMGSLWPVMLMHVLIDINTLVLRPLVSRLAARRRTAAR